MPETQKCGRCRQDLPLDCYAPSYRGKPGTWCRVCFAAWHRGEDTRQPLPARVCPICSEQFYPKQQDQPEHVATYCSRRCKDIAKNRAARSRRIESMPDRWCLHCGDYMPRTMRADAVFCSDVCNSAAHAVTRVHASRKAEARPSRLVFRAEIAERDDWTCGICGEPVDKRLTHPSPGYGSIDHVVALAAGGGNEIENLQLAHLVCNLRKRQLG